MAQDVLDLTGGGAVLGEAGGQCVAKCVDQGTLGARGSTPAKR